jgi:transcriptional regulator with XRE-family HTH domain
VDTNEYPDESSEGLAERIRTFRRTRGMTQRELADRLAVTQQSVARWEQGSPPRRYMLRVIESLISQPDPVDRSPELADIIGIRTPDATPAEPRGAEEARRVYVQGCLKLLERGERLPNRVLLLLADELGWDSEDG